MHNNIMAAVQGNRPPNACNRTDNCTMASCCSRNEDHNQHFPEQTTIRTVINLTPENKLIFESEKEAIHLILTGIGDEIYSTVDACDSSRNMGSYRKATTR
ncbi:hypothetical protein Tco_0752555 [Tanacetum coccineum]|uniref:Uncharacterized protein n=1 Tax=Tanacetum coccineum TaxID=301880 RepID=A0ABQ4Z763_9ASTR